MRKTFKLALKAGIGIVVKLVLMTGQDEISGKSEGGSAGLLTEQAHLALVGQLRDGRLKSGTFLSMPMLVERLGMPIAAVRDAVKRAEAGGLLEVLPKRGVMVMDAGPEITRECLDLRAIIDSEGARRLIEAGTGIPLAKLREDHERLRDEAQSRATPDMQRRAIQTDLSLHDALVKGIRSKLVGHLYAENRDRIAVIQNMRPFLADRIVPAMTEHLAIIEAIELGDTERAVEAIQFHLRNTLRWWGIGADTVDASS